MFSSKERLIRKTGKHGVGRFEYLQQLVNEYKATKSRDAKEQVLANLANFAYDPINYDYLWRLRILDLFFGALEESNTKLVSFAIGGICNISLDPKSRDYIVRHNGVHTITSMLSHKEESVVLSSITTLIYLNTPQTKDVIATPEIKERMLEFSKSTNRRIKNLADVFLEEVCKIKVEDKSVARTSQPATSTVTSQSTEEPTVSTSAFVSESATLNVNASTSQATNIDNTKSDECSNA